MKGRLFAESYSHPKAGRPGRRGVAFWLPPGCLSGGGSPVYGRGWYSHPRGLLPSTESTQTGNPRLEASGIRGGCRVSI
jgi:hypothetical protein